MQHLLQTQVIPGEECAEHGGYSAHITGDRKGDWADSIPSDVFPGVAMPMVLIFYVFLSCWLLVEAHERERRVARLENRVEELEDIVAVVEEQQRSVLVVREVEFPYDRDDFESDEDSELPGLVRFERVAVHPF